MFQTAKWQQHRMTEDSCLDCWNPSYSFPWTGVFHFWLIIITKPNQAPWDQFKTKVFEFSNSTSLKLHKMQRLISLKVASDISRRVFTKPSSLLHSHPYKTFFSLSQPSPTHHLHTTSLIPPPHFPWPSHHGLSRSVYGFISNPTLLKQFLPTALLKGSSKTLAASRVGFLRAQFPRRSFGFSPSFDSYGRRW